MTAFRNKSQWNWDSKWRKPEGMLPIRLRRTICIQDSPGARVRFGFQKWRLLPVSRRTPLGFNEVLIYLS